MHHDRLGVTKLPGGVTRIGAHQIGDLGPERHMSTPPLLCVGEAFPFVPGDVVPDEVQRNDPHSGGRVSLIWPHRDGLMWPHFRHAGDLL